MIKLVNLSIALCLAGGLSLAGLSPSVAKGKANTYRATSPSHRAIRTNIPRPAAIAPAPPIVRCLHGVWDPYGVRCDTTIGGGG
jgi:hypothetical protein